MTAVAAAVLGFPTTGRAQAGATYQAAAFDGETAPGGGTFYYFSPPTIASDGTLAFSAGLSNESNAVVAGKPGALIRLVSSGNLVPGGVDEFSYFDKVSAAPGDRAAFGASVYGESSYGEGVWIAGPKALFAAIDPTSALLIGAPSFRGGNALAVKIAVGYSERGEPESLQAGPPGSLKQILKAGDAAPGLPQGTVIEDLYDNSYYFFTGPGNKVDRSENGALAFKAIVSNPTSETNGSWDVIYAGKPGALVPVAQQYAAPPGLPGYQFGYLSTEPSVASNGMVAFSAEVHAGESGTEYAVFAGPAGGLKPIVKSGAEVPTAPGVVFHAFDRAVINETGDVVFGATILYPNQTTRYGFWIQRRTGRPVLLAVDGITLDSPSGPALLSRVDIAGPGTFNDLHEFAFQVESDKGYGVYVADTRPGAPWIRITDPRTRKDQVTQDRVVRIAGVAMDETGIADVKVTVEPIAEARGRKRHAKERVARQKTDRAWSVRVPLAMGRNLVTVTATDVLGNVSEPLEFEMIRWSPKEGERRLRPRR